MNFHVNPSMCREGQMQRVLASNQELNQPSCVVTSRHGMQIQPGTSSRQNTAETPATRRACHGSALAYRSVARVALMKESKVIEGR